VTISPRFIEAQLERMSGLEFFATLNESGRMELARALSSAPSEIAIQVAVDEWIRTQTKRPTPADLYAAIKRHAPRQCGSVYLRGERGLCFNDWKASGLPDDWDAFLAWAVSGQV